MQLNDTIGYIAAAALVILAVSSLVRSISHAVWQPASHQAIKQLSEVAGRLMGQATAPPIETSFTSAMGHSAETLEKVAQMLDDDIITDTGFNGHVTEMAHANDNAVAGRIGPTPSPAA